MFTFTLLTPGKDNHGSKSALITIDNDVRILADPAWNGKNVEDLDYIEPILKQTNIIILSHSTPEFLGAFVILCVKYPDVMKNIKVYSTTAISQLGRVSTVEFYRSVGIIGPLKDAIIEVSDVDEWFDTIIPLKYFQTVNVLERLVFTPYNSGHTLGGSFWLIQKKLEKIIYAPSWNHSKDSFLNAASFLSSSSGNPISQLMRPTGLITSTDLGSNMPHRKRTERFLSLVDATLTNGGTVLLPTSISGRFLELLHLIDQHLKGAPIPVLFLSYSGTNVLRYATSLLEWMNPKLAKEIENANSLTSNLSRPPPFDPSRVDLISSPYDLTQMAGPKVVFTSGVDLKNGELSSEALRILCQDEKTTIILTEKTHFGYDNTISSQLYNDWYHLCKQRNDNTAEDGIVVPLEKTIDVPDWYLEEDLVGSELNDFRDKINMKRKQKLLEQVRERKNRFLAADRFDASASSSEEEDDDDDGDDADAGREDGEPPAEPLVEAEPGSKDLNPEKVPEKDSSNGTQTADLETTNSTDIMDDAATQEALVSENIKTSMEQNLPLDIKITNKLRPRQAMFPFFSQLEKQDFDDYGAIINPDDFKKKDDFANQFGLEHKRNQAKKWRTNNNNFDNDDGGIEDQNKLTPQEMLNNEIIKNNLDSLFRPRKRVPLSSTGSAYSSASTLQQMNVRCGLSFVDLSGLVDLRSLGLIISSLKPANLLLLPDSGISESSDEEMNGLKKVQKMIALQQETSKGVDDKNSVFKSARFLSLSTIRSDSFHGYKSTNKMEIQTTEPNETITIGNETDGVNIGDFEIKLDESIIENLKWQGIDGSYKVAQVAGLLEIQHHKDPTNNKRRKTVKDIINLSSEFNLKGFDQVHGTGAAAAAVNKSFNINGPKIAIGNIRLPDLKRKLMSQNLNAEFKSEGTLVVNDKISITKVTYGASDSDDTGDIIVNGQMGPLYYQVKNCIRDMLAYV